MKRIYVFVYVRIRVRWIGPYAWRNVSWVFAECSPRILWADVALLTIRQQCFGNPFAMFWQTVSSRRGPIYRAHIYVYTHEMANGNAYAIMWMHVFDYANMYIWWCQDTGAMNRPLRLTECFVGVCGMFATYSLSVCYIFTMQKYGFCATKVWFLACKNPLFTLQKPPFWNAIY